MKLNIIKKLARRKQLKIMARALTTYSKEYGEPSEKTLDKLGEMLDRLLIESEEQVVSCIVFAEEMLESGINDSGVEWKDKDGNIKN